MVTSRKARAFGAASRMVIAAALASVVLADALRGRMGVDEPRVSR